MKKLQVLLVPFAFSLVAVMLYWPGLDGPVIFDDLSNIISNQKLRISDLSFASLGQAANSINTESAFLYRPLTMITFAVNYYFSSINLFHLKATNLLIHIFNAILVYYLLIALLKNKTANMPLLEDGRNNRKIATIVAFIWLIHPLNLTSVLYIVQRMNSLSALFVLAGLLAYVIFRARINENKPWAAFYLVLTTLACLVLAFLSKENGILFVAFAFLIEFFFFRFKAPDKQRIFLIAYFGLFLALPLLLGLVAALYNPAWLGMNGYQYRDFTLVERLLTETRVLWFYVRLIVAPTLSGLGLFHDDIPLSTGIFSPVSTVIAILAWIAVLALAYVFRNRYPLYGFCVLWFLVGHSMESTIIPLELVYEHRNYLPQIGIMLVLVTAVFHIKLRNIGRVNTHILLASIYVLLLMYSTFARSQSWADEWTLFNMNVKRHPESARAHSTLGLILHDNNAYDQAEYHFTRAAQLEQQGYGGMLRLLQHLAVAKKQIDPAILDELERRMRRDNFGPVTLWVIDPLLIQVRYSNEAHKRMIGLSRYLVEEKDIKLPPDWLDFYYRFMAREYHYLGDHKLAVKYYNDAYGFKKRVTTLLSIMHVHLTQNDKGQVSATMSRLKTEHPDVSAEDQGAIDRFYEEYKDLFERAKIDPRGFAK